MQNSGSHSQQVFHHMCIASSISNWCNRDKIVFIKNFNIFFFKINSWSRIKSAFWMDRYSRRKRQKVWPQIVLILILKQIARISRENKEDKEAEEEHQPKRWKEQWKEHFPTKEKNQRRWKVLSTLSGAKKKIHYCYPYIQQLRAVPTRPQVKSTHRKQWSAAKKIPSVIFGRYPTNILVEQS